jgi:hypothetical protein
MRSSFKRRLAYLLLVTFLFSLLSADMLQAGEDQPHPVSLLAWVSTRDGNPEIYVLDMTTNILLNVSRNPAIDESPAWLLAR